MAAPAGGAAPAAGAVAAPLDLLIKCDHCHMDLSAQLLTVTQKFGDDTAAAVVAPGPVRDYLKGANYKVDDKQQALAGARGFLFQYLHSIRHWYRTIQGTRHVEMEKGQDVDIVTARRVAGKTVLDIREIQYKHETASATISCSGKGAKSGGYKCVRNAIDALLQNEQAIKDEDKTFTFEYVSTAKGTAIVTNWNAIHHSLQAGRLGHGQGPLLKQIAVDLFNMSHFAKDKPADNLDAQLNKFTDSEAKVRGLISQFSWTLEVEDDLEKLKKDTWKELKDEYATEFGAQMQFPPALPENEIQKQVLPSLVGEMVLRIAEGDPLRRRLVRAELVDILKMLRGKLQGGVAGQRWDALYKKHKDAGYTEAFRLCAYAAQYTKIADKAAALGGFQTDMLLNQYRNR